MKSVSNYLLTVIGALLGLALVAGLVLNFIAQTRLNKRYEISVDPIAIPEGESARGRGEHLVRAVSACIGCHGPDLGGQVFIDEPIVGQIYAPNLTSGKGGKASRFSSEDCHGENLAGGRVGPDDPFAPNLTRGGELAAWTEEDFFTLIRTGVHPGGRTIDPVMPWQSFRNMTDTELRAVWAYLQGLPALPTNEE